MGKSKKEPVTKNEHEGKIRLQHSEYELKKILSLVKRNPLPIGVTFELRGIKDVKGDNRYFYFYDESDNTYCEIPLKLKPGWIVHA